MLLVSTALAGRCLRAWLGPQRIEAVPHLSCGNWVGEWADERLVEPLGARRAGRSAHSSWLSMLEAAC